jgi:hypothetical protein
LGKNKKPRAEKMPAAFVFKKFAENAEEKNLNFE